MKVIGQISYLIWGKHQGEGFDPETKIIIILVEARLPTKLKFSGGRRILAIWSCAESSVKIVGESQKISMIKGYTELHFCRVM